MVAALDALADDLLRCIVGHLAGTRDLGSALRVSKRWERIILRADAAWRALAVALFPALATASPIAGAWYGICRQHVLLLKLPEDMELSSHHNKTLDYGNINALFLSLIHI